MKNIFILIGLLLLISCSHENRLKGQWNEITEFDQMGNANWSKGSDGFEANKGEGYLVSKKAYKKF